MSFTFDPALATSAPQFGTIQYGQAAHQQLNQHQQLHHHQQHQVQAQAHPQHQPQPQELTQPHQQFQQPQNYATQNNVYLQNGSSNVFDNSRSSESIIANDLYREVLAQVPDEQIVAGLQHQTEQLKRNGFDNFPLVYEDDAEGVTIEKLLEDDPLLSFTTTLDRQESNDTILQSSSPVNAPIDYHQSHSAETPALNLNRAKEDDNSNKNVSGQQNFIPTPASSTSHFNSAQSPVIVNQVSGSSMPRHIGSTSSEFVIQQGLNHYQQLPQHQSSSVPSVPQASVPQYPPLNPDQMTSMPIPDHLNSQIPLNVSPQGIQQQYQQIQHFHRLQQQQQKAQQYIEFVKQQHIQKQLQQQLLHQHPQQLPQSAQQIQTQHLSQTPSTQNFSAQRASSIAVASIQSSTHTDTQTIPYVQEANNVKLEQVPLHQHRKGSSSNAKDKKKTTKTKVKAQVDKELPSLPPTPPSTQPLINKSSSTTKLNKVKKVSTPTGSSGSFVLKKSRSFLTSPSASKPQTPLYSTLDFSKQIHGNLVSTNSNFSKMSNQSKPTLKVNSFKNYEFVFEKGGNEKSKSSSNLSTPSRRQSITTGTPPSAKFPKFSKPPVIDDNSSFYSPNSSPANSDGSGHSPITSFGTFQRSPIPSSFARFSPNDSTTSPINDSFINKSKKNSISSATNSSPDKSDSPPFHMRDMKSGMIEFKVKSFKS